MPTFIYLSLFKFHLLAIYPVNDNFASIIYSFKSVYVAGVLLCHPSQIKIQTKSCSKQHPWVSRLCRDQRSRPMIFCFSAKHPQHSDESQQNPMSTIQYCNVNLCTKPALNLVISGRMIEFSKTYKMFQMIPNIMRAIIRLSFKLV